MNQAWLLVLGWWLLTSEAFIFFSGTLWLRDWDPRHQSTELWDNLLPRIKRAPVLVCSPGCSHTWGNLPWLPVLRFQVYIPRSFSSPVPITLPC